MHINNTNIDTIYKKCEKYVKHKFPPLFDEGEHNGIIWDSIQFVNSMIELKAELIPIIMTDVKNRCINEFRYRKAKKRCADQSLPFDHTYFIDRPVFEIDQIPEEIKDKSIDIVEIISKARFINNSERKVLLRYLELGKTTYLRNATIIIAKEMNRSSQMILNIKRSGIKKLKSSSNELLVD